MSLLPLYINNSIEDGTYIHVLPFCKNNCSSEICSNYYKMLVNKKTGTYCCPHGLSTYVLSNGTSSIVFTGLKVKDIYDKKKSKSINPDGYIFNPIISEESCAAIASEMASTLFEKEKMKYRFEAINDLLHETRTLNAQTKNAIDLLWENNLAEDEIDYDLLLTTLKNAHVSSYMISSRFSYFDSVLNPQLFVGEAFSAVVFKKFDKMRKLLKGYLRKNVWISLNSPEQSNYRYDILPSFEILLFILLENAIKYSPDNKPINVSFLQNNNNLDITIESIGPYSDENEILHLCEKGFRGENAKAIQQKGQGFGLSFAKKICEQHSIPIRFNSIYSYKDHGIKYGTFQVHMHFDAIQQN